MNSIPELRAFVFATALTSLPTAAHALDAHYGPETTFSDSNSTGWLDVAALGQFSVVAGFTKTDAGDQAFAKVGSISGQSINWDTGAAVSLNPSQTMHVVACRLDSTRAVFGFVHDPSGTRRIMARVGLIAGTTISFPTAAIDIDAVDTGAIDPKPTAITCLDASRFVLIYRQGTTQDGVGVVGTVGGTAITLGVGGPKAFDTTSVDAASIGALDPSKVFIAWNDGTSAHARVGSITGSDWSTTPFGARLSDFDGAGQQAYPSVATVDATHAVIAYKDASGAGIGQPKARIATISGTNIPFLFNVGPLGRFETAPSDYVSAARLDAKRALVVWENTSLGRVRSQIVRVTGNTATVGCGQITEVNGHDDGGPTAVAGLDSNRAVVAYADLTESIMGNARVANVIDTVQGMTGFELGDSVATGLVDGVAMNLGGMFDNTTVRPGSGAFSLRQTGSGPTDTHIVNSTCSLSNDMAVRFSFRAAAAPGANAPMIRFVNAANGDEWRLDLGADMRLHAVEVNNLGLPQPLTGTRTLIPGTWYTISIAYSASAGGPLQVWLDDGTVLTSEISAQHAIASGLSVDFLGLSGIPAGFNFDDVYITDGRGRPPRGRIVRLVPSEDTSAGFTLPCNTNRFTCVDEVPPDDASTESAHISPLVAEDRFGLTNPPPAARYSVKSLWRARGDGTQSMTWLQPPAAPDSFLLTLDNTYDDNRVELTWGQVAPSLGQLWNATAIDGLELGLRQESGTQSALTFVGAMVDFGDSEALTTALAVLGFEASGADRAVRLTWRTSGPVPAAFHVWRARRAIGPFEQVTNEPIAPVLPEETGSEFAFQDRSLEPGTEYFYEISSIEDGTRYGTVSASTLPADGVDRGCSCSFDGAATLSGSLAAIAALSALAFRRRRLAA